MKKLLALVVLLSLWQNLLAGDNEEFRATWVITWEYINSSLSTDQNKTRLVKILDDHKKANMNAVLWQCRQSGTAYYPSSFEPWGYYAGNQDPGYDPLALAVEEAHQRGLELHAWFNVFQTSSTYPGAPAKIHPEWICRDQSGIPMTESISISPGLAEVREYTIKVAMEIVRKYDIDGLHLDYVRWNEYTNSPLSKKLAKIAETEQQFDGAISEEQIADLNENKSGRYLYDYLHPFSGGVPTGFSSWEEWWRWSVTEFVRVLHDSIQSVKPWVRLSAAVLGKYNWDYWQGYGTVYQDAALWFNEGYVDQLTPMHYHWTTGADFRRMLVGPGEQCWRPYIQPGITAGRLYTVGPGSYQFANQNVWSRHANVVETVRDIQWVDGFQFFSYGSWEDYNYWQQAKNLFFDRKTKIRATKLIDKTPPDAPSITMTKIDSLSYQILLKPPASLTDDNWFACYRSEDDDYNVKTDFMVDIKFGSDNIDFLDQYSGLQDFNGVYKYFATCLDRYWNESAVSNVVTTELVPSFAPTIISSSPAAGDTIPVNKAILLNFSKTMDSTSFDHAITFVPGVAIKNLCWSEDQKSLTVVPTSSFNYSTEYMLTLVSSATDINGRALDGNGDGLPGDPFELHFWTQAIDLAGPHVMMSYPDYAFYTDDFIFDEVITVVFNEQINRSSVNSNSVKLRQAENEPNIHFLVTEVNEKSVLSIQSLDSLKRNADYSFMLTDEIADTIGNQTQSAFIVPFHTSSITYAEERSIDKFLSAANWEAPSYSGTTVGIVIPNTVFEMSTKAYLPSSATRQRIAAVLRYEWDVEALSHLIREYCFGDQPRSIVFDTSYVLQCFLFGDGSKNKFRFCLDEAHGSDWPDHEVSHWMTIDWYGWRLIEWKLNDPNSVGDWIGNSQLDGTGYRIDSFQFSWQEGAAIKGEIFIDNLRIVKKATGPTAIREQPDQVISAFGLEQNYPNPFNLTTTISFVLPQKGHVQLKVYNTLGHEVLVLLNKSLEAGKHQILFDGSGLASGIYLYSLVFEGLEIRKSMLLIK